MERNPTHPERHEGEVNLRLAHEAHAEAPEERGVARELVEGDPGDGGQLEVREADSPLRLLLAWGRAGLGGKCGGSERAPGGGARGLTRGRELFVGRAPHRSW